MQARVVVFPVKGRAWCFALPRASAAASAADGALPPPPPTLRDLWRGISSGGRTAPEKAEAVVDFVADKVPPFSTLVRVPVAWRRLHLGFLTDWFRCADEQGVDRVRERAGGVDEEPDP